MALQVSFNLILMSNFDPGFLDYWRATFYHWWFKVQCKFYYSAWMLFAACYTLHVCNYGQFDESAFMCYATCRFDECSVCGTLGWTNNGLNEISRPKSNFLLVPGTRSFLFVCFLNEFVHLVQRKTGNSLSWSEFLEIWNQWEFETWSRMWLKKQPFEICPSLIRLLKMLNI